MILLKKRTVWCLAFFACMIIGMGAVLWAGVTQPVRLAFAPETEELVVWILDPGHGGEDGGAVSKSGISESHINLEITLRLRELLRLMGQHSLMTRETDGSVCDEGLPTIRARKISDIRNRVALVNETGGGILVSIHQNSLPSSPETRGAQVFRNRQEGIDLLADAVQDALNQMINKENPKVSREIPKTIYLMNHVTAPAILVECGFLSNEEEAKLLTEPDYQTKLATVIVAGCLRTLAGEDAP